MSEDYAARPHPEFVVLDIGGRLGALIVHTDAALHGVEVEISPTGADDQRSHKEVLERRAGGRAAFTAVFDRVVDGDYTLWVDGVACARDVHVTAGMVAQLDWTGAAAPVRSGDGHHGADGHQHDHGHRHIHEPDRGHMHAPLAS
jgi:hypothetical protein